MASNLNRDLKLEIAHVLFIDIVGYSRCATDEQSELLEALNEAVRSSPSVEAAEKNGTLIELPTGDGMALVFRDSPEAPAQAAIEISQKTQQASNLRLRMGIHSGPVNAVADVSGRPNVAGVGINLGQRIMDCGDAGHILVSNRAAEDLAQHRRWQPFLHDIGEAEVKHGAKIHLFNFCGEGFGNAALPGKLKRSGKLPSNKTWALVGLIIGVAAIALLVFYGVGTPFRGVSNKSASDGRPGGSSLPITDKSIAVLPFENLSDDKNNAYFIDGIQDEILTRLAKVADLKVISRTSTQRFKSKPGDLPDIARQLGVAHILEGSAQRSADQVRVNVQLIKAATDAHLWAETYDRKLSDIFGVETEIASKIADVLRAKLTGAEHIAIAVRPTENMEAHDFYLKGRYSAAKRFGDSLRRAIEYYNQALAKDPNYALAYAGIADSYALLPEYSSEPPDEAFRRARAAAEKALSLDNNLAEAHTSLGLVLHAADLNFEGAKQEFERAIELILITPVLITF
jgi:TolB-like protein/class 3 adenylate cyclase